MISNDQEARILQLESLLREANETLDAIRNGEVDAVVVSAPSGQFVYTLENADRPYRVLVEQMKEGAVTLDKDGVILYTNRSFGSLIHMASAQLVGTSLFDYVVNAAPVRSMLSGESTATAEVSLIDASGSFVPANMSIVELQTEDGAPPMFCSIVTDLTEIRRAEDDLRQVQKMDAVGQLTGGVAHDFNNLLMAITSSLAMLEKRLPDDPQIQRLIANAQQGAQRGAALTQRMLAFARRQDLKPECVDVASMALGMKDLVQRTLGPVWPIQLDFPEQLSPVLADANQLEMALLNLAVNARDAMPSGGKIRVTAEQRMITTGQMDGLAAGRYICLSVIDDGEGMDAETLLRATEPFFTTKGVGKGTGLGLSMVHGLARQLNGTFVLESALGKGTCATLWLLAAEENGVRVEAVAVEAAPQSAAGLKIVAVDDDVLIRMNIAAMLEDMGHVVFEASSGDEALALLREHPDTQLLITDQAMPNMTGTQLIDLVVRDRPDMPIVLATGYGELSTHSPSHIVKLGKPFNDKELAGAVDHAMANVLT